MSYAVRFRVLPLSLFLCACGGVASSATEHLASGQTVSCNALPPCPEAASIRIAWPGGAHAPIDASIAIDGATHDALDAELGVCATPGTHHVELGGTSLDVDVREGMHTLVTLGAPPTIARVLDDVVPLVASLDRITLPATPTDDSEAALRAYAAALVVAHDAFRARLADVQVAAHQSGDVLLLASAAAPIAQANARAEQLAGSELTRDRLTAIATAMHDDAHAAASMIAIDRMCPVWSPPGVARDGEVSVEVRPRHLDALRIVHVRVAIDDVVAIDEVEPEGELDQAIAEAGIVAAGEHAVSVDAEFAPRPPSSGRTIAVHRTARTVFDEHGMRVRVDVGRSVTPTTAIEEAMTIAIEATSLAH
jgi:hypothetical protein